MNAVIRSLTIQNFKGIKKFTLSLSGKSVDIHGDNATGKTTLGDAFRWLLFDKDSQDKKEFSLKPLDADGKEPNHLDHSVASVLLLDGKPLELQKILKEKWVKKQGSTSKKFEGHSVEYLVDGVPRKQKEYKAVISELIDEENFKLLTSPDYFNSMKWEKQRELLIEICGDVDINDVVASNDKLKGLIDFLGDHSASDKRKIIASQKSKINKKMIELPARIAELDSTLVEVSGSGNILELEADCNQLRNEIEEANAGNGKGKLREDRQNLLSKIADMNLEAVNEKNSLESSIRQVQGIVRRVQSEIDTGTAEAERLRGSISNTEKQIEDKRAEWHAVDDSQEQVGNKCPACQQELPDSQIQRATDLANVVKAKKLEAVLADGERLKRQVETAQTRLDVIAVAVEKAQEEILTATEDISNFETELNAPQADDQTADIKKQVELLDEEIEKGSNTVDTGGLKGELETKQREVAVIETQASTREKIKERTAELKELGAKYEELEQDTVLLETYIVSKIEMLDEKINAMFSIARFKLFEEQINGGIKETCQTLYNGVPFHSGLNSGAKIQVGLDIIKTFQKHFGIVAPIWIDNAEGVTELPEMDSQMIRLVVDGGAKELEIKLLN